MVEQASKDTSTKGVWGHAPPGNILILDPLRSILGHFGTHFQRGKARVQAQEPSTEFCLPIPISTFQHSIQQFSCTLHVPSSYTHTHILTGIIKCVGSLDLYCVTDFAC